MRIGSLAIASAAVLLAHALSGATFVYVGTLTGAAESPPNVSPGTGTTTVTYDDVAHTLHVQIPAFSGLTGTTTASHIHCCTAVPFTSTAGVATTTPSFAGFPLGVSAGSFDNTLDLTQASSWNPAFVSAQTPATVGQAEIVLAAGLVAGTAYLNIHTSTFAGGEIRSFLTPAVPVGLLRFTVE